MKEVGTVQKIDGEYAFIRVEKKSACGENCATCKGGCVPTERIIKVKNTKKCQSGDKVALDMNTKKVMSAAFMVYIIPLVMLILGYFLGESLFGNEGSAILSGVVLMIISMIIIAVFDRLSKDKYMAEITEIINKDADD